MKYGITYSPQETIFRIWSPLRNNIDLCLYEDQCTMDRNIYSMKKLDDGVHEVTVQGDLKGYYYTYLIDGIEVVDPYSIAASMNSTRSAIIDLEDTNPRGWNEHCIPNVTKSDAVIYEVHIKDFTGHESSEVKYRGKYLGFIEKIPHLKELGVTFVHLMPVYDFITVKEEIELFFNEDNYNWGYDPELYNVPEGSYATNPEDPLCRIRELKTLIMELHMAGLKVILDVVYNHTYKSKNSNFNIIMPGYFYRTNEDGSFSNGSGCGNEIASERPMVRKFIIDSLEYWVSEYKIDGFRFDLMGLIDIDTIEETVTELRKVKPEIFIYGEPWAGGSTVLPVEKMTLKGMQKNLSFAIFNDSFRNAIKGDNDGESRGFAQGNSDYKHAVEIGITGSIDYDDYRKGFTNSPLETINYINSHDNLILADKIKKIFPYLDEGGLIRINKFAHAILFTSQGIPFIHAGNEFLRSKKMDHNSYNSSLNINGIDWYFKGKYDDYFRYIRDLIDIRKVYKEFKITDAQDIRERLKFIYIQDVIAFTIKMEEGYKYLLIIHNNNNESYSIHKNDIKNHLNYNYGFNSENIDFELIFDENGLVRNSQFNGLEFLVIPYTSTAIFILSS
ncbi:type I pullulanase [Tissierella sp. Yu-01]|uniref:type I pullulanase n=1 Tax=Tissierella sp. Yu-01 TaxID=3035694 RepID=UPI00240E901A|nr:type I pullulanase [Tissierella sp. Yu-01]WFA08499.1 type I pullulanase [Tissierella sp. Yu-01]